MKHYKRYGDVFSLNSGIVAFWEKRKPVKSSSGELFAKSKMSGYFFTDLQSNTK
jgi:hypothetical protein